MPFALYAAGWVHFKNLTCRLIYAVDDVHPTAPFDGAVSGAGANVPITSVFLKTVLFFSLSHAQASSCVYADVCSMPMMMSRTGRRFSRISTTTLV